MRHPALIFDFGKVLVDWDPRHLYQKFFPDDPAAMERFLTEVQFYNWVRQTDSGRPFTETINEWCACYPNYCKLIRSYDERYEESIIGPIQGTVEILHSLKEAGYPLYGLSNWPQEKYLIIRPKFDFFDWFDDILISGEVKLAKPDPKIFQLLLERIQRKPEDCLLIDDSQENIRVAAHLGFQTILFTNPEDLHFTLSGYIPNLETIRSF